MLRQKSKFDQNNARYHNVYTPRASELEEDNIYQESDFEQIEDSQWKILPGENNRSTIEDSNLFYTPVYYD